MYKILIKILILFLFLGCKTENKKDNLKQNEKIVEYSKNKKYPCSLCENKNKQNYDEISFDTNDNIIDLNNPFLQLKLSYLIIDSINLSKYKELPIEKDGIAVKNSRNCPDIKIYEIDNEKRITYKTKNNKWIAFSFPFENLLLGGYRIKQINLDKKRKAEIILEGADGGYGSGGGSAYYRMFIISIDSIPTKIFDISFGCFEESFGDRQNNGKGRYFEEYVRKIQFVENKIVIEPKKNLSDKLKENCELTDIAEGIYIMKNGKIIKE